jgi:hypothetical protein
MPVNILRIEETDETGTFVPGHHLPMERRADTFDVDIPPVPQPLPPWMNYVPQAQELSGVYVRTRRAGSDRLVIHELNAPPRLNSILTSQHHGADYVLVGNGTVVPVEAKNTYVQGSYTHGRRVTHADPTDVWMIYYRSLSSSTEQELPFRTLDIFSRGNPSESLADYDAYAVDNWDGYDALPITNETLHAARSILKSLPKTFGDPVCSPGADGSIVFEWLKDDGPLRKLFIDIGPGRTWKAYWRLANGKIGSIPRKRITISTTPEFQKLFETLLCG